MENTVLQNAAAKTLAMFEAGEFIYLCVLVDDLREKKILNEEEARAMHHAIEAELKTGRGYRSEWADRKPVFITLAWQHTKSYGITEGYTNEKGRKARSLWLSDIVVGAKTYD